MELYSAEVAKAKALVESWWSHPDTELEATFGIKGQVDVQTFLTVASRLRSKGLDGIPQQDRMNICLPDHVRFGLVGFGLIQQYCKDDLLTGKPFIAMIKDRSAGGDSNLDIDDYNLRVKSRRELNMATNDARVLDILNKWKDQRKAFRLIRRWTYEGKGIKYDMSMVRSTPRDSKGEFKWVRKFKDNALLQSLPIYEIEVELERDAFTSADDAYKALMKGIGEVLRGIQRSSILIRKSNSINVLEAYTALSGTPKFRGVAPKTLELQNMTVEIDEKIPNIRQGYNVTDKADGLRVHAFCDSKGELFMIDMSMTVYRTGLKNPACANSLLDGEWVTRDSNDQQVQFLLMFDMYIDIAKQDVTKLPFQGGRHARMMAWSETWNGGGLQKSANTQLLVSVKQFFFGKENDKSIFLNAGRMRDTARIYPTDGLIFTSNTMPLPSKPSGTFNQQFKWKPSEDNTIDFLVTIEKDPNMPGADRVVTGIHPSTGELRSHKILRLFIGSSTDPAYDDPRATILYQQPLPEDVGDRPGERTFKDKGDYKPVLFNPKDFPDTQANVCYREVFEDIETNDSYVLTERTKEPIRDKSIVECRYDPLQDAGWRWIPIRVRNDKTDRLLKAMATKKMPKGESVYARTLNSELVAESVWNSIHQPITESMIRTGNEQPNDKEARDLVKDNAISKKYYDRKAPKEDIMKVRGLRDFHNKWVKDEVLYGSFFKLGVGKTLIDVAVGKAGDLQRWRRGKAAFVLGLDAAGENIRDSKNGAYERYMETLVRNGKENTPTCVFVIGESQKRYVDGTAGATDEEKDILRSIFGKVTPQGAIPPYIDQQAAGRLRNGVDGITCQFALHYFFNNEESFNGLLQNISDNLKIGGYFFGTAFDGERVFQLLRGLPEGGQRSGVDNASVLWTITKRFSIDEIPVGSDGFGLAIDVEFISIGTSQMEYLVPFDLLVNKMKTIGLELLEEEDLKVMGLGTSSGTFDLSYDAAKKAGKQYQMIEAVKQFSFLNRWFIFKRTSQGPGLEVKVEEVEAEVKVETTDVGVAINEVVTTAKKVKKSGKKTIIMPPVEETEVETEVATQVASEAPVEADREVKVDVTSVAALANKVYSTNELFQFFMDAALQDKLKTGDKSAARWLAPGSPFPIPDIDNPSDVYPSVEHYIAGQRLKLASNKPELGSTLFGREGSIHQKWIRERLTLTDAGTKALSEDKDQELLKAEIEEVRLQSKATALRKYGAVVDEAKFATVKNKILRDSLKVRLEKDARFRRIVEAARDQGKILLYYTGTAAASELGGVRRGNGQIDGENKIGKYIMELAGGFPI